MAACRWEKRNKSVRGNHLQWANALAVLLAVAAGCVSTNRAGSQPAELGAVNALPSAQAGVPADPAVVVSKNRYRKEYVLAPQDVIEVSVLKHNEVTRACLIRPDGYISLPILDDVKAAGFTPSELDAHLTGLFSKRLKDPEVTIVVTDLRPPLVYVLGEVGQPRAVPLREAQTAVQAVASAGGFTTRSKEKKVVIIRLIEDNRLMAIPVQVQATGRGARYIALGNVPLEPDDVVFVPKKPIAKLNVFLNESINPLLSTVNNMFSTYTNVKLIEVLEENIQTVRDQE
jgi:polysaccharide export outer membrane protein